MRLSRLPLLLALAGSALAADDGDYVMRWSSTGGGWRAMVACMGYANTFNQAGLFRGSKSRFSAIVSKGCEKQYVRSL